MNVTQLPDLIAKHKPVALGVAAAGVVGLGLYQRKKAGGDVGAAVPAAQRTAAGAAVPYSAGGQTGGTYDSTSNDVYSALQPALESLGQQLNSMKNPPIPVPVPLASTLFAPALTGKYVRYNNGTIAEVQNDGSLFGLMPAEWDRVQQSLGGYGKVIPTPVPGNQPNVYTTGNNLVSRNPTPAS